MLKVIINTIYNIKTVRMKPEVPQSVIGNGKTTGNIIGGGGVID